MSNATHTGSKLIVKNTLMMYVRLLVGMGVSLFTSRIVLEQLGVEDYGIYNVVGGVVVMLSFLNSAMSLSSQRFFSFEIGQKNSGQLAATFRCSITIHLIIALAVLVLAETLGLWFLNKVMTIPPEKLVAANRVYQCSVVTFLVSIVQVPFYAAIIARERMEIFAGLSVVQAVMKLAVAFVLIIFSGYKLEMYALLNLTIVVVFFFFHYIYCKKCFAECHTVKPLFDKAIIKPMIHFMSWSTLGSMSWIGKTQGCNLLLNIFFGPIVNASYAIAGQVNIALHGFVSGFTTAINPQITKTYSSRQYDRMEILIINGAKISFFLLLILSFPILMATEPILKLWLGTVPQFTVVFTQLILINSLVESFSYCMGAAVRATGRVKWYEIVVSGSGLLTLPISYVLLHKGFEPQSVFIVNIGLSLTAIAIRLYFIKIYLPSISIAKIIRQVFVPSACLTLICGLIFIAWKMLGFNETIHPVITIVFSIVIVVTSGFLLKIINLITLINLIKSK